MRLEYNLDDKMNQLFHLYIDCYDKNDDREGLIEVDLVDVYQRHEYHNLIDQQHDVFLGNLLMDERFPVAKILEININQH